MWTRIAREVYPTASFVLVEPRFQMRAALDEMCSTDPHCRVVAAAAGASVGHATLTDWDTGSTLLNVGVVNAPQLRVPVVTLDSLSREYGIPQLLKLDVEGFEIEVLRGGLNVLRTVEVIILEAALYRFAPNPPMLHEVVAFLAEREFFTYDFAGFMRRPFDGALGPVDVCFARRTAAIRGPEARWA